MSHTGVSGFGNSLAPPTHDLERRASNASTYSVHTHASYHCTTTSRPSYSGGVDWQFQAEGVRRIPTTAHRDFATDEPFEPEKRRGWRLWRRRRVPLPVVVEGAPPGAVVTKRRRFCGLFCEFRVGVG
jgi:hypothetical protein